MAEVAPGHRPDPGVRLLNVLSARRARARDACPGEEVNPLLPVHSVVSHGDCLEPGTYLLHSTFRKAVNYYRADRLLSFVTPDVGGGPATIVLDDLALVRGDRFGITKDAAVGGGALFRLSESTRYVSSLSPPASPPAGLEARIALLDSHVRRASHPASLAFLLDGSRKQLAASPFEKALRARVEDGWRLFRDGRPEEGIHRLRGAGLGLTPSGDDFIAGLSGGLHLHCVLRQAEAGPLLNAIFRLASRENLIAWNFIRFSTQGRFPEKVKCLLQVLIEGPEEEVPSRADQVLAMGETSGADFCTGLLCALKMKIVQRPVGNTPRVRGCPPDARLSPPR